MRKAIECMNSRGIPVVHIREGTESIAVVNDLGADRLEQRGRIVREFLAAPDLLEACRAIRRDLENGGELYLTDRVRIDLLSDAINKAEGK